MSFESFALRYRPWLEREARRLCVPRADMEWTDLVQEGLLRAWLALPRWRLSYSAALPTWLLSVAHYGMLDSLRRMARPWDKRRRRHETRHQVPDDALVVVPMRDESERVDARLTVELRARRLPPRQRELVALMLDGLHAAAIARRWGCSEGYVSQVYRAALAGMR